MHFDLPILTSDRDFARERCQGAAIYFDPLDAASVAGAMARVMEDADLRNNLVENGRSILAQAPTWDEIAARFVEVLERTARGESPVPAKSRSWHTERSFGVRQLAAAFSPASSLAGNRPPDRNSREQARGEESGGELPHSKASPQSNDVRTLFNQKARRWRSKYGPKGKLNSRVEHFTARLAELCPPPSNILDLGCGTGEIAAAIDHLGYQITACDLADEMIDIARRSYAGTSVNWVCLEPDWEDLPFEDSSFDGVVASSVFEYLDDVPRVAAELARVLRPEGILLLTVPNPCNVVRKVEAGFYSMLLRHRLPPLLRRVQRIDSYAAYLRLSRNRFEAPGWQSVLSAAHFAALDENDFSPEAWQHQAQSPLVLLAVKRAATAPCNEKAEVARASCPC
jgi:ubiquinone/menaquinone biosynthesis C-methylase UbiE